MYSFINDYWKLIVQERNMETFFKKTNKTKTEPKPFVDGDLLT